jgi:ElaB/YqjD/DUF883 family membrane-anchored ribosome-binding protein
LASRTKDESHETRDSIKELKRDFERRVNDIQADIAEGHEGMAEEALAALGKELQGRIDNLREQVDESFESSRDAIRSKPITALGAAVATGVVAGLLLGVVLSKKGPE